MIARAGGAGVRERHAKEGVRRRRSNYLSLSGDIWVMVQRD